MLGGLSMMGGGGGFSGGSSSAKTTDMSSMAQSSSGGQGVGSVNVGGDAASTLARPWWMGGAGWRTTSPAAGVSVQPGTGMSRDTEAEGRDLPAWALWGAGGLALLGVGAAAFFGLRGS